MKTKCLLMAVVSLILLSACNSPVNNTGQKGLTIISVPAPVLKNNRVHIKVAYVINPDFEVLSPEDITKTLETTRRVALEHFDLHVTFAEVERIDIEDVFRNIPLNAENLIKQSIIDIHKSNFTNKDRQLYSKLLKTTLRENSTTFQEELGYTRDHLDPVYKVRTEEDFVAALTDTIFSRVKSYQEFLGDNPYNEWLYWQALGYTDIKYDLLITNQPIISIETMDTDIHHALRGGISVGSASFMKNSPMKARVFWSTFTFFQKHDVIRKLRGNVDYSKQEAIELSGAYLTHELGHMLLHLDHPFGNNGCVMTPVPLLDVRSWYESLDAPSCQIGSSKAMTKGSMKLFKIKELL